MLRFHFKYLILLTSCYGLIGCSLFGATNDNIPTIPQPPQKMSASDVAIKVYPKPNASEVKPMISNQTTPSISEERGAGGTINQIKVKNPGDIPDYYIYPSQQQNLNINHQVDQNISTPTWQISW